MRRFGVALTALIALGSVGIACSSDTGVEDGELRGGSTGKGGTTGKGTGGTISTTGGTGNNGSGGSGSIPIGGSNGVGGSSTAGSSTGSGGTMACVGDKATGMKGESAVLLLVVDISFSMTQSAPGDRQSKLDATKDALTATIATLPEGLSIGLMFYPNAPLRNNRNADTYVCFEGEVAVPIAPINAAQRAALTSAVTAVQADGHTPTHDAYQYALAQLQASGAEGQKYVVLITDGVPTFSLGCVATGMNPGLDPVEAQPIVDEAQAANTTNMVKTFVVGSPGSEDVRTSLSAIARVGGTGPAGCSDTGTPEYCHSDMTDADNVADELTKALGEIAAQIPVDCNFDLPTPPSGMTLNLDQVNVRFTDANGTVLQIGRDPAGDCATDGWRYVGGTPPTGIELCGPLCDTVKAQTTSSIEVEYGCNGFVEPPR